MGDVRAREKDVLAVARLIVALLPGGTLIAVTRELRQFRRDGRKKREDRKITCLARKKDRVTNEMAARLALCSRERRKGKLNGVGQCVFLFYLGREKAAGL